MHGHYAVGIDGFLQNRVLRRIDPQGVTTPKRTELKRKIKISGLDGIAFRH
jgi:hypothetical protein